MPSWSSGQRRLEVQQESEVGDDFRVVDRIEAGILPVARLSPDAAEHRLLAGESPAQAHQSGRRTRSAGSAPGGPLSA